MKLNGRRESNNVEDRRCMSTGAKAGIGGIGGILIIALLTFLQGGNLGDVVGNVVQQGALNNLQEEKAPQQREFTEEEQELAKFSRQVLGGTEDVWTSVFEKMGRKYTPPTLVLFTGGVNSACGSATSAAGPFYCSGDQKLYLDLTFFTSMKRQLGADGDFAYAYVIAHEVGHHIEEQLGILQKGHQMMNGASKAEANRISVRLELLADYYAGVWAHYDNAEFKSLEDGDLEEAIDCAEKIGDNYLQQKHQGHVQPDAFTHGTSAQRMKWLKMGIEKGDMSISTFDVSEAEL